MDSLEDLLYGIFVNDYEKAEKVGRDVVNNYTIDTCYTNDCGWETAVWYMDYPMVIVGRYPDKETAEQGHANWVDTCRTNNPTHAYSIQTGFIEPFMEEY